MHDVLVVGNGLAGLICALELARAGRKVALLCDGRAPGGHFRGIQAGGLEFDIGMVMLEQGGSAQPCHDVRDYQPLRRNDWTRFGHIAAHWLQAQLPLRRVPTPSAHLDGRTFPDPIIANRLDVLAGAGFPAPAPLADDPLHARHKLDDGPYDGASYAEAAARNHGPALHEWLFEPFVRKLTGAGSQHFLARQHRAAWAPLYYPETLALALAGAEHGLPEYPFWVPESGCVAQWIRQMHDETVALGAVVEQQPLAALKQDAAGWTATSGDGSQWRAPQLVLAAPAPRCADLFGLSAPAPAPAVSVSLWFCSVPAESADDVDGCRMVIDERHAVYRITCPERQAGLDSPSLRIVAEANPDVVARRHPGVDPTDAIRAELAVLLGLASPDALVVHKHITAANALALPTPDKLAIDADFHARLAAAAPGAHLTGTLLGYGIASINDQIVQALQIARSFD